MQITLPRYINEKQVAEISGMALSTLRNDRANSRRIPYCKIGRAVRYLITDVINFMESKKVIPDGEVDHEQ